MSIIGGEDGEVDQVKVERTVQATEPTPNTDSAQKGITAEQIANMKVGRNDPCPCGSGKKFKHCHGK